MYDPEYERVRLGRCNDGGYVICKLPGGYDCFLSGGIADDISFEQDLLDRHEGLACYAFDGSIERLPHVDPRITFIKKNLGRDESDSTTNLHEYLDPHSNVFMKIDIEGNEFRVLPVLVGNYLAKVKQLVLEIHSPGFFEEYSEHFRHFSDVTHETMWEMLGSINETHTLVHLHPNNACQTHIVDGIVLPNVFECTYIRNDFAASRVRNRAPLPTRYDMPNDPSQPEIRLSGFPFSLARDPEPA